MNRVHLFEFEDQKWLPPVIRNGITEYLQFIITTIHIYRPAVPMIERLRHASASGEIMDLCSGAGGPWYSLLQSGPLSNDPDFKVHLSDFFPNKPAFRALEAKHTPRVIIHEESIDATNVQINPGLSRTLFSAFHHFTPDQAEDILRDAVVKGGGIGLFEMTQRSLFGIFYAGVAAFLSCFLFTPFYRTFCWKRLVLTYLVPVIPICLAFDATVSAIRTYTPDELIAMARRADPDGTFVWESGRTKGTLLAPVGMLYLIGVKQKG